MCYGPYVDLYKQNTNLKKTSMNVTEKGTFRL